MAIKMKAAGAPITQIMLVAMKMVAEIPIML